MRLQRQRLRVQRGVVVLEIQKSVRLVDIKPASQSPHHHRSSTPSRSAALSTPHWAECPAAFSLRAIPEFLNPLLQLVLVPASKILAASLCSRNAD